MKQHYGWSLFELEAMMPFERIIYVSLLENHLKDMAEKKQQQHR